MEKKKSLKQQFESMKIGVTTVTDASKAMIFVNAKRAGVTVSTKKLEDGRFVVTLVSRGEEDKKEIVEETLVEKVQKLLPADKEHFFAQFELCCYMNRGECMCPEEEIVVPVPDHQSKLERAREALASVGQTKAVELSTESVEEDWRFTREPVMWDGQTPYRKQWTGADKPVYRVVEVDEFDPNTIVRVK